MDLSTASRYAAKIVEWLSPNFERIEIAGSIRRGRPHVNDIDIVCIPRCTIMRDMFQVETGRQNHLWMFLVNYVNNYPPSAPKAGEETPRIMAGCQYSPAMKQMIVQLPRCQLDLWFATEETFASILLMRTGSKEHNIWFAQRAQDKGYHWNPYEGLVRTGFSGHENFSIPRLRAQSEAELYAALGLTLIEPANRESEWLHRHIDSGL